MPVTRPKHEPQAAGESSPNRGQCACSPTAVRARCVGPPRGRGSAGQDGAQPQLRRAADDRLAEHEIRQAHAQMRDEDPALDRRLRARDDRLADRGRRVRVAVEIAGVAVGEELRPLVDREQGSPRGRPRRTRRSRSRPRRPARRASASPASGPGARRRRRTRRRSRRRRRPGWLRGRRRRSAPRRSRRSSRACVATASDRSAWRSKTTISQPGSTAPRTGRWLRAWTPAPSRATRAGRPRWPPEPADGDAADRRRPLGGDRPGVEDRRRDAGRGIRQQDEPVDRREPALPVGREPRDPLDPEEVPGVRRAAEVGRHRVGERALRPWVDADLRWQLGVGDQRDHRPLGQAQPLVERRHRRLHVRGVQPAERGRVTGRHRAESSRG